MQVVLNSQVHIQDHRAMAAYLDGLVTDALGHHGGRVMRVDAHLSDLNSTTKPQTDDVHCTLEASLAGMAPVVVEARGATMHQAVNDAVARLSRAVGHALGKHDARRTQPMPDPDPTVLSGDI